MNNAAFMSFFSTMLEEKVMNKMLIIENSITGINHHTIHIIQITVGYMNSVFYKKFIIRS